MWRCKKCGKTNIIKKSSGQARWIHCDLDEDGCGCVEPELIDYEAYDKEFECEDCGNRSSFIEDIAEWVEE